GSGHRNLIRYGVFSLLSQAKSFLQQHPGASTLSPADICLAYFRTVAPADMTIFSSTKNENINKVTTAWSNKDLRLDDSLIAGFTNFVIENTNQA
ncbi:MAG: hypothetical protein AAFN92_19765, partial [Bacteroidota bacterium]